MQSVRRENIPRKDVQKEEQKKPLPPELMEFTSPFRSFDRLWKPYYTLIVQYPNESRCPMLTTFDIYSPKLKREELFPAIKTDITIRRYYKFVSEKPDYIMEPEIFIGTVEGRLRSYRIEFDIIVKQTMDYRNPQVTSDSLLGRDLRTITCLDEKNANGSG